MLKRVPYCDGYAPLSGAACSCSALPLQPRALCTAGPEHHHVASSGLHSSTCMQLGCHRLAHARRLALCPTLFSMQAHRLQAPSKFNHSARHQQHAVQAQPYSATASAPWQQRSQVIMGEEALVRLANASVMVVGLGGVGSWCAEMLCRAGVSSLVLVDGDTVDSTNRNRQLPALATTIGRSKVEVRATVLCATVPDGLYMLIYTCASTSRSCQTCCVRLHDVMPTGRQDRSPCYRLWRSACVRSIQRCASTRATSS